MKTIIKHSSVIRLKTIFLAIIYFEILSILLKNFRNLESVKKFAIHAAGNGPFKQNINPGPVYNLKNSFLIKLNANIFIKFLFLKVQKTLTLKKIICYTI